MKTLSVLLKPASSACNMNCAYCFYKDEAENRQKAFTGLMSLETAEIIIQKAVQAAENEISFMFQGGEPTLAGLDFYKAFIDMEQKYSRPGLSFHNAIQTNGLEITEEWADFFKNNSFLVGLSLDGNSELHNRYRKTKNGDDTFNKVMKAASLLDKYKIEYNVLCVLTEANARNIEKIYHFFSKKNFGYLQFIPCLEPLNAERGKSEYALSIDKYGDYLIRIFRLWFNDLRKGKYVSIRHIDNFLRLVKGLPPECCSMSGRCSIQFVIEGDGTVYPCDFYALDEYKIGNILCDNFTEICASPFSHSFVEESALLPEDCRTCPIVSVCRNGCKRDRTTENKNYYCEAYKRFFDECGKELIAASNILIR